MKNKIKTLIGILVILICQDKVLSSIFINENKLSNISDKYRSLLENSENFYTNKKSRKLGISKSEKNYFRLSNYSRLFANDLIAGNSESSKNEKIAKCELYA